MIDAQCNPGEGNGCESTVAALLSEMDRHGVARAVVVPVGKHLAVYNREGNDRVLSAAKGRPDRLIPFATANPWYGEKALAELERAFDLGAAGVKLHPGLQGFRLTDPVVRPLVGLCARHSKPIYFHMGTPVLCMPYQLTELAMQYPEATFIMGRAAWSDFWYDVPHAVQAVNNIWVETSHHVACFISLVMEKIGSERIVFGSDWPHNSMGVELAKITRFVARGKDRENILQRNMARILGGKER